MSQDAESPESVTISRRGTEDVGPIRRVRFTRASLRQPNIRDDKGPSLNKIQVKSSHQRSPYTVKFEDQSHEETEGQERCASGDAWTFAKNIFKLKETEKATFYLPSDEWFFLAASTIKLEEREFVTDSVRSKHAYCQQERR